MTHQDSARTIPALDNALRQRLKQIKQRAKSLLTEYSNKIPQNIVSGKQDGKYSRYKIQKNWFNLASLVFLRAARRNELDEQMMKVYKNIRPVFDRVSSQNATRKDIRAVDNALRKLIRYCNRRLGIRWWHYLIGMS